MFAVVFFSGIATIWRCLVLGREGLDVGRDMSGTARRSQSDCEVNQMVC